MSLNKTPSKDQVEEFKGETKVSLRRNFRYDFSQDEETAESFFVLLVTTLLLLFPAYLNDSQRQVTKDAGAVAGLNVLKSTLTNYCSCHLRSR